MDNEIFEDLQEKQEFNGDVGSLMSEERKRRGQRYSRIYSLRRAEVDDYKDEWDELQKAYACERDADPIDPNYPNSIIPLLTPIVEGQVASMMESDIQYTYTTNNPAHRPFMPKLEAVSQYVRNQNQAHRCFKDYARIYDLLGNSWISISWEKTFSKNKDKPSGYPRISVPPILSILVDGRIKDYKDLQFADYIIHEIGFVTLGWAKEEYKKEPDYENLIGAIKTGNNRYDGKEIEVLSDDEKTFKLLHVWTRNNEHQNLQLIEMTEDGLILRESDPAKPYYEKVDNEYPFYFGRMIPRLGRFYGYGDGKILQCYQKYENNLMDELIIACRFNAQPKTYIDFAKANMKMEQYDSDPSHPIGAENPHQTVRVEQPAGVSPVIPTTFGIVREQAQYSSRFSEIMTGNQKGVSATATQINSQMSQGNVGINDKKNDIATMMKWVDRYCIKLCMEKWDVPFWANLGENRFEHIDMSLIAKAPVAVPMTGKTLKKYEKRRIKQSDLPNFEVLSNDEGLEMTDLDFDVDVSLGVGFPRGKNDVYYQIVELLKLNVLDTKLMKLVPFIDPDIARDILAEIIGFKLNKEEEEQPQNPVVPSPMGNALQTGQSGQVQPQMNGQTPNLMMQNAAGINGMQGV